MFDPEFQRKALSLVMGFIMEFSGTLAELEPVELTADNLNVSTISVSCLKVTWDSEPDRDYYVSCTAHDDNYAYADNMYFEFKSNDLCYITGLREGTEYTVTVEPVLSEEEQDGYTVKTSSADGKTETVEVIYEFPDEEGWDLCYCGERKSGLTRSPSWDAAETDFSSPTKQDSSLPSRFATAKAMLMTARDAIIGSAVRATASVS